MVQDATWHAAARRFANRSIQTLQHDASHVFQHLPIGIRLAHETHSLNPGGDEPRQCRYVRRVRQVAIVPGHGQDIPKRCLDSLQTAPNARGADPIARNQFSRAIADETPAAPRPRDDAVHQRLYELREPGLYKVRRGDGRTNPAHRGFFVAIQRFGKTIRDAGHTVFATIDHASAAEKAGLRMPPSTVLIFGNPKGGTPLMLSAPTMAIDLPLKILVWDDASGKTWVSYNTATYAANRHALKGMEKPVQGLDGALNKLTTSVVE